MRHLMVAALAAGLAGTAVLSGAAKAVTIGARDGSGLLVGVSYSVCSSEPNCPTTFSGTPVAPDDGTNQLVDWNSSSISASSSTTFGNALPPGTGSSSASADFATGALRAYATSSGISSAAGAIAEVVFPVVISADQAGTGSITMHVHGTYSTGSGGVALFGSALVQAEIFTTVSLNSGDLNGSGVYTRDITVNFAFDPGTSTLLFSAGFVAFASSNATADGNNTALFDISLSNGATFESPLRIGPEEVPVPEPMSLALLAVGVLGLCRALWARDRLAAAAAPVVAAVSLAGSLFGPSPAAAAVLTTVPSTQIIFGTPTVVGETAIRHIIAFYTLGVGESFDFLNLFTTGANASEFDPQTPTCDMGTQICEFDVEFSPAAAGTRSATLVAQLFVAGSDTPTTSSPTLLGTGCVVGDRVCPVDPTPDVPEPASLLILAPVLGLLAWRRGRLRIR